MTIEDVDWILRFPCDELVMPAEMLNRIQNAIAIANRPGIGVKNYVGVDAEGRRVTRPIELAGRKLTIKALGPEWHDCITSVNEIHFLVKGERKVSVLFE